MLFQTRMSVEHRRRYFEEHWLPRQLTVAIDLHSILWKTMATVNCLVTNILQNIFFCAKQVWDE